MTAQDTENMASICPDTFRQKKLSGIESLASETTCSLCCQIHTKLGGQLDLLDRSETGLCDTEGKIGAKQRVQNGIKACTVNVGQTETPPRKTTFKIEI